MARIRSQAARKAQEVRRGRLTLSLAAFAFLALVSGAVALDRAAGLTISESLALWGL